MGPLITADGLRLDAAKLEAVWGMPPPLDQEGVHRSLGFLTYLLKFISNLRDVDALLCQFLKRDVEFVWQPAQQAFDKLKELCIHSLSPAAR